jgi:electron transfer flavoprotein alpha subunit
MGAIWVYSEDTDIAKQLLTLGRQLAEITQKPLCSVVLNCTDVTELITSGADKVYCLSGDSQQPESYDQALAQLAEREKPDMVFVGATMRGKDLAAKLAARLKAGLVSDACEIRWVNGTLETERMMYGGLAICTESLQLPALVTVPPRSYEAPRPDAGRKGEVVNIGVSSDSRTSVTSMCPVEHQGADIATAERIVCVGRGLGKQEDLRMVGQLADVLSAEIGCTRSIAEDYHWLPNDKYIGLSGQKTRPELYLSLGVSGQVQHVAGIRDSHIIVAIDSNENAPIFDAADYGIVGNLYDVVPALTEAIRKANAAPQKVAG